MIGRVVSTKTKGAATVLIERMVMHPLYKKTFVRSKKYLVDAVGVKDGDIVEIVKVRPISKNKHWKVVKVLGKDLAEIVESAQKEAAEAAIAEVMPEEKEESRAQGIGSSEEEIVTEKEKTKTKIKTKKEKLAPKP